jgi:8-oxo-dGTP pyrophosphatase MutT (NUDIX family)
MVRRHVHSDFAPDVFVFPGGKVDPVDRGPELRQCLGIHHAAATGTELALRAAAIRELFEEAGVLLARRADGTVVDLSEREQAFAEYRRQIHSGELTLLELARAEGLQPAVDLLHPFSHWITPESFPRRYDTRFFAARLPLGQSPLHDALETTDSIWINPGEALERFRRGTYPLVFATEKNLERMARFGSFDQMVASTTPADLQPIMPRMVQEGAETRFLIPGDDGY